MYIYITNIYITYILHIHIKYIYIYIYYIYICMYIYICDQLWENRSYLHILYFEKYEFEILNALWYNTVTPDIAIIL